MDHQDPIKLYEDFFKIVERGDEAAGRKFLTDNIKQFPQEAQDVIITAFLEEALIKKNHEDGAILNFQKEGIETLTTLGKLKEELEKKLKLAEIKRSIKDQ